MSHTPGPWSFAMEGETNYARIYLHDTGMPCRINGGDALRGYCGKANARLIAAAPDLLEAAKTARHALSDLIATGDRRVFEAALSALDAAIDKAEGRP